MKIPHKFGHIRVNFLQSVRLQVTHAQIPYWLYDLCLECDSHICSVIMSNICAVLLVVWLMPVTLYVAYICAYISHICMSNIHNMAGIFVSGTYLAITCEVEIELGCVLPYLCKNTG